MASIKDALEESITDNMAFVKYFLFAIPVFISYELFAKGNMGMFCFVGFITVLILLGLLVECIHNVRNGNNHVLPTFNIFVFGYTVLKTVVAVAPILSIGLIAGKLLTNIQIPIAVPNVQLIYAIIVWLIIGSIVVSSLIIFAKTKKVKDAYNLKLISDTCIDILVAIIFFLPQLVLLNGLILGAIAYLFAIFWELNCGLFIFICCMALVQNIVITGNYFAQIDYEIVPREENN